MTDDELLNLSEKLRNLFPKGVKKGTNLPWREHPILIKKRLLLLQKRFNCELIADDILNATKQYVESFNGDYTYMRTLKYFILKRIVCDGEYDYISDLLTHIEMLKDGVTPSSADWVTNLI